MARLATMKPGLAPATGRLPTNAVNSAGTTVQPNKLEPWRAWYGLKRWKDIRWQQLVDDLFTCRLCGHMEADTSLLVCDHINPHRGNSDAFWRGPFQTLCQFCHATAKKRLEVGGRAKFHPDWLLPAQIPLTIVCGPPASGKSLYVSQHAMQGDIIIDLDLIACGLSGASGHEWDRDQWLQPALFKRNAMLAYLSRRPSRRKAWFIVAEPKAEHRTWWQKTLLPQSIVVAETPADVCMQRALLDADRDHQRTSFAIEAWWRDYTPRAGDHLITT